jgi:hypothetical protein
VAANESDPDDTTRSISSRSFCDTVTQHSREYVSEVCLFKSRLDLNI